MLFKSETTGLELFIITLLIFKFYSDALIIKIHTQSSINFFLYNSRLCTSLKEMTKLQIARKTKKYFILNNLHFNFYKRTSKTTRVEHEMISKFISQRRCTFISAENFIYLADSPHIDISCLMHSTLDK